MPKLKELTSQPMPPRREFVKLFELSPSQYPFTCQMFLRAKVERRGQRNDGFYTFLIPYMAHRANLHTLEPITRLRLVDESTWTCTGRFGEIFPHETLTKSFGNLVHLDLCVSNYLQASAFKWLGPCIKEATALEELRLCFERSRVRSRDPSTLNIFTYLFPSSCSFSSLRTLILVDMPSTLEIYKFIRSVASSLKTLRFENTAVTVMFLKLLSNMPNLRLEHFMSLSDKGPWDKGDDWEVAGLLLTEEQVLDVLNGTSTEFFRHWPFDGRYLHVYTHYRGTLIREPSFFDSHHRVTSQDGSEDIQLVEWAPSDSKDM